MSSRTYKVAGIVFRVQLEEPISFMNYSPVVLERIRKASQGQIGLDITPTRAGDKVPHRTLVQSREELVPQPGVLALDMSQYEPFLYEGTQEPVFTLKVVRGVEDVPPLGNLVTNIHSQEPYYSVYEDAQGGSQYTLEENPETFVPAAIMTLSKDYSEATLYCREELRAYSINFQLSTALMIVFTYNAACRDTLLIHASVIGYKGAANIFLGKSGTGKSTHSKLWLSYIPDAELLNDDNPALGFDADGNLVVYGTPWSGKTPCYRNVCAPVRAIVRLEQAPANSISRETGLNAFTTLYGSVSSIRWRPDIADHITKSIERAAMGSTKFFVLNCLPDEAAALLCRDATLSE